MAEHPAGTVTVHGVDFDVTVNDDGEWIARVGGPPVIADTKAQLKAAIEPRLRHVKTKIKVPFVMPVRDGESRVAGAVRCTATGIHSGNGRVLARRDDTGEPVTLDTLGSVKYLAGDADPDEWARLLEASMTASKAVYAYEQDHKIDVRKAVRDALKAAAAEGASDAGTATYCRTIDSGAPPQKASGHPARESTGYPGPERPGLRPQKGTAPLRGGVMLNETERKVWAAWNVLPDNEPSPVKRIARALGMEPADVAFIVYPAEQLGRWDDSQEPDLGDAADPPPDDEDEAGLLLDGIDDLIGICGPEAVFAALRLAELIGLHGAGAVAGAVLHCLEDEGWLASDGQDDDGAGGCAAPQPQLRSIY